MQALHEAAVSSDDVRKAELRTCAHAAAALTQRLATRAGGAGGPSEREQLLPASYIADAQAGLVSWPFGRCHKVQRPCVRKSRCHACCGCQTLRLRVNAQGLAFLFTSKGGLGLSFEHGWGCVIQRLGKRAVDSDAGSADGCVWSAPAFVRINSVGVGLTVGARRFVL